MNVLTVYIDGIIFILILDRNIQNKSLNQLEAFRNILNDSESPPKKGNHLRKFLINMLCVAFLSNVYLTTLVIVTKA